MAMQDYLNQIDAMGHFGGISRAGEKGRWAGNLSIEE
jgi:hypothetical protein